MKKRKIPVGKIMRAMLAILLVFSSTFIGKNNTITVEAANEQFTLGSTPVPRNEVAYTAASTRNVSTGADFVTAYKNTAVNRVVLDSDITLTGAQVSSMNADALNRSMQVDGGGFTLTHQGASSLFVVSDAPSSVYTIHLKNIRFNKVAGDIYHALVYGGNGNWDVILDDMDTLQGVRYTSIVYTTDVVLFFRNTVKLANTNEEITEGTGNITFEDDSNVVISKPSAAVSVFWDSDGVYKNTVSFGKNSVFDAEGGNGYPIFYPWQQFDLYQNANVYMHKLADVEGVQDGAGVTPLYRIDSGASLLMENEAGPAIIDYGNATTILANSGASVQFIGSYGAAGGGVRFTEASSKLVLDSPKYFDIRNMNTGFKAFHSTNTATTALQLLNVNLGVWGIGVPGTNPPTTPSPFNNVSVYSTSTTSLTGTSPEVNTMAGGWDISKYSRIAFSTKPTISVSDINTSVAKSKPASPVYTPSDVTLTYSSANPGIASVDANGTITGVSAGTTTFTVTATSIHGATTSATANVTVTNTVPVLTVPAFTEVQLGQTFDPLLNVSATDFEDGTLVATHTGTVDTSQAGVYAVDYSTVDSNNNTVTKKQVVVVNDGSISLGVNYLLQAYDFSKLISQVNTSNSAILTDAKVKVYEKATGLLSNETVNITNTSSYGPVAGEYNINFQLQAEPTLTSIKKATVSNGSAPVMTAEAFSEININSTFNYLSNVSVTDVEDVTIVPTYVGTVDTTKAGVYTVDYSATDADGNNVTSKRVVVVNDGTLTVGTNYIIQSNDFTKRVGQVDLDPNAIKSSADLRVYSKTTGALTSEATTIVSNGGYKAVPSTYDIVFNVSSEPALQSAIKATVEAGNLPTLTVPEYTEVTLNASFDPLTSVSATDIEDGSLIPTVNGAVNTAVAGVYVVNYSVTDSDSNVVNAKQVVLVNDGTFTTGATHIVKATDFTKRVSEVVTSNAAILANANVKVYDKATGLESSEEAFVVNNGGYSSIVNDYSIEIAVTGDLSASRDVVGHVITGNIPTLTVPAFTELTLNADFNPLSTIVANDAEDGALTPVIAGSVDTSIAGVYTLDYTVTDVDGNTVTAKRVVLVNDSTFVAGDNYILKATDFTKRTGQVNTAPTQILLDSNTKVFDKMTGLESTQAVNIVSDSGYSTTPGVWQLEYQVSGDANAKRTINATVIAGQAPTLTVPEFTEINVFDSFDIMNNVVANDTEDGTLAVTTSGTVDTSVPGVYVVVYSTVDSDNNVVEKKQVVLVNDGNYILGGSTIIHAIDFENRISEVKTDEASVKTDANFVLYDKLTGELSNYAVFTNNGTYTNVVGVYPISFVVPADNNFTHTITATVISGDLPVLTAPSFTEVAVSGSFDESTGVTVTDTEDGNITPTIVSNVDTTIAGVYKVQYSAVDTDGNAVSAVQVVVVNDGSFEIGANYLLKANSFEKRISEVDTADAVIKTHANLELFDKATGDLVSDLVNITETQGYKASVGVYDILFSVDKEPATTKTIQASVIAGDSPVITIPSFTEITVNDAFDPLTNLSATDTENGNLIDAVQVVDAVDDTRAGVYRLDYTVVDSDGNTASAVQVVLVNDGSLKAGNDFIIDATDYHIGLGHVNLDQGTVIAQSLVKVYSKTDGLLTAEPVSITHDGGYKAALGAYTVEFTVDSDSGAKITNQITVVTGEIPVLTNPTFTEVSLNGTFNALDGVTATDIEDGNLVPTYVGDVDTSVAGVYVLDYTAIDSDLNEVYGKQVVLVNDGTFIAGERYILKATDFERTVGNVDTSFFGVIADANVNVYSLVTGVQLSPNDTNIISYGNYNAQVGQYDITLEVGNDGLTTKVVTATVTTGDIPVLTAPAFTEINLNDAFDVNSQYSANDTEDGILVPSITGSVDTTTAGLYVVTYSVTDSDSNTVTVQQVVLVNDGTYTTGADHIIKATDFTIRKGQVVVQDSVLTDLAHVTVYDKLTGQLSSSQINVDDQGGYSDLVNDYTIKYSVAGDSGANMSIVGSVITGALPLISGPTFTELPINGTFLPMESIVIFDLEDGTIIPTITNTVNMSVAGVYAVDYVVTDSDNNTATHKQVVLVNDGTYNVGDNYLLKAKDYTIRSGQVDTLESVILSLAEVTLYDKMTGLVSTEPVSVIDNGGYSSVVNPYSIVFEVNSDPSTKATIVADVLGGELPSLYVPAFTEIDLNTAFDPLTGVIATDLEDGNLVPTITGAVDTSTSGIYVLNYTVVDTDGNSLNMSQTVLVNDGTFNPGDKYILQATDFTLRVSQVDTTASKIQSDAIVKVFDINTGLEVTVPVTVDNSFGYTNALGEYVIDFYVQDDTLAFREIKATVITGELPILTVPAFTELAINDSFDEMLYVVSEDVEDGIIAPGITHQVDTSVAGVYVVDYTTVDIDGNTATAKQVLLVNDGTFVVGDNHLIQAQDFTKRVGTVMVNEYAVLGDAKVLVYDLATGLVSTTPAQVVSYGGYSKTIGAYVIDLAVQNDLAAAISVDAIVISGDIPVLAAESFTELAVNDTFDPMSTTSANDTEDGTLAINVDSNVDTTVAGVYTVKYFVMDSDANLVELTRVVLVNDGTFTVGGDYLIKAQDFTKRVGQVVVDDTQIKLDAGIQVYEKMTGLPSNENVLVVNNGGYSTTVDVYSVEFAVENDLTTGKTIQANVVTGEIPTITTAPFIKISVGDSFNPILNYSAFDVEDGNVNVDIVSNVDVNTPGVYTVNYSGTDSDSNYVSVVQVVLVDDGTFTVSDKYIIKAVDFTHRVSQVNTLDDTIVSDAGVLVYDILTGEISTNTVQISDIGGYDAVVGTYTIELSMSDDATFNKQIIATVISGDSPVITMETFTEIDINSTFDPMTDLLVNDTEDGDSLPVTYTGSVDTTVAGVYKLDYSVVDLDGNETVLHRVVLVNDGTFVSGEKYLVTATSFEKRLSQYDGTAEGIFVDAKVLVYDKTSGDVVGNNVLVTEYGGYEQKVGKYNLRFTVESDVTASTTVEGSLITGEMPVLTAPGFTELTIGDNFEVLTNVVSSDVEDGVLSPLVAGIVDTDVAGVYVIDYNVTDSDNNTVSTKQVVLVNDGTYQVGSSYILKADDYTLTVGNVTDSTNDITNHGNVQVYDILTGLPVTQSFSVTDDSAYTNQVGVYPINIALDNDVAANITVDATVITGELPILTVPAFTQITVNELFDVNNGVVATDTEDGDLELLVTGSVDNTVAGVYTLVYDVMDSDGNAATATQVVLVNDGTFVVGDNFIIKANDFTNHISAVDATDAGVISDSTVQVFDILTGLIVSEQVSVTNNSGYTASAGLYPITLTVDNDQAATITINANVIEGEVPVLDAEEFTEINVNDLFDPMYNVVATDTEDGDITANVEFVDQVDTTQAGLYQVVYSVTDMDGNVVSKTRVVLVNDGTYSVGGTYVLKTSDFTLRVGQVDVQDSAIIKEGSVQVFDKLTGNLLNVSVLVSDNGGYTPQVGQYNIKYTVKDDALANRTSLATVIAGQMPVLTVETFTELQINDSFDPMLDVQATDLEDGNIAVQYSGDYDLSVAGVYNLEYTTVDSDGNTVTMKRVVLVNDGTYAVGDKYIIKSHDAIVNMGQVDTSDIAIINEVAPIVYDKFTGIVADDVSLTVLETSGYTTVVGDYAITVAVETDLLAASNSTITVIKGEVPVLVVPEYTELKVNDVFDYTSGVSAMDAEDGDITALVTYEGQVDTTKAGIYKLMYQDVDSDGNVVTAKRTVLVNDGSYAYDNGLIIEAHDFKVYVKDVNLTDEQIIKLAKAKVYDCKTDSWIAAPEYTVDRGGYTNKVGTYEVTIKHNPEIKVNATVYDSVIKLPSTGLGNDYIEQSAALIGLGLLVVLYTRKRKQNL